MENYLRSAGCVIYEFVMLVRAFRGKDKSEVNKAILTKPVSRLDKSFGLEPVLNL
jgi:hypothetical protein